MVELDGRFISLTNGDQGVNATRFPPLGMFLKPQGKKSPGGGNMSSNNKRSAIAPAPSKINRRLAPLVHYVMQRGPGKHWGQSTPDYNLTRYSLVDWEYWFETMEGVNADAVPNMLEADIKACKLQVRYNCPHRAFSAALVNIWINEDLMNTGLSGPTWDSISLSYPYSLEDALERLCMTNYTQRFGWDLIIEELTPLKTSKLVQVIADGEGAITGKEINDLSFNIDLTETARLFRKKTQERALDQSLKKVRCFTVIFVDHHIVMTGDDHTDGMTATTEMWVAFRQASSKRLKDL